MLNEVAPLVATTPPALHDNAERHPDVLCPVEIHVHDPAVRERRRSINHHAEKRHQRTVKDTSKRWIDLDENVLDGYILIDDRNLGPSVPQVDGEELPYPEDATEYDDDEDDDDDGNQDEETGSHDRRKWSTYNRSRGINSKRYRSDFDFGVTYPLANSHGNAYQDSSSHSKYTELCKYQSARNNLEMIRGLDGSPYVIANSHGKHGDPATDIRTRDYSKTSKNDNLIWDNRSADMNYEIANSHSNYRVFYDSQTQHQTMMPPWSPELRSENSREESRVASEEPKDIIAKQQDNQECEANTNQSEKKDEPDSGTACDIEQCLVQIEESLLNIEQNLLHVQDLDIPELRNLLYKSPSIERSLYEVQDLLYADGIVPVNPRNKSMSIDSDEEEVEENEEEEEIEEEEVWVGQNVTIKDDNEDGNADAPLISNSNDECSDTVNVNKHNPSRSADDRYADWIDESNVLQEEKKDSNSQLYSRRNFVLNSLGKTLPRKIALDEVKENIRLCSSEPEEPTITIDYNLNTAYAEKKSLFRDKWHSRASSLDENSIFQNLELGDKQENDKTSLQDVFLTATGSRRLATNAKALSEGTLPTDQEKRRDRRGSHEEKLLQAVEATAADFRKKLESFALQRRSILHRQKRITPKSTKEVSDNAMSRSREKSPTRPKRATAAKTQDRDGAVGKNTGCDKRKRKKTSGKNQGASENALIPSKLISLSLSLLLAALLQAVRCLSDLVEDAFRSISYDRSGLLQ